MDLREGEERREDSRSESADSGTVGVEMMIQLGAVEFLCGISLKLS